MFFKQVIWVSTDFISKLKFNVNSQLFSAKRLRGIPLHTNLKFVQCYVPNEAQLYN